MATTILSAAASTKDPLANELKVSMFDSIRMLDADDTQFTTMLQSSQLQKEKANSFKEEWLEDLYLPRLSTLGAGITSAADVIITTATSEGYYFRAGDLVRIVTTGECLLVTAGNGVSSFTATRGIGTVAAITAASANADLVIVGHSDAQGATLPTIMMTQRTTNYNYTVIQRHSYGFTRTAMLTQWYGGPLLDKERAKKIVEHKRSIENSLFFGPRYYTSTGPQHTSGGLVEFVTTNVSSAAGTFTKANLQTFLRTGLQYGNLGQKVLFAAPLVAATMAQFLQDNWIRATPDERVFGARINGVIGSAYGGPEVPVVIKRDWNNFQTGTGNQYGSRAFLVDTQNVQYLELTPTTQLRNRQAPDYDGVKEEYLTEHTFRCEIEKSHQLWTNITG